MSSKSHQSPGFSLIELVVIMLLVALLAGLVAAGMSDARRRSAQAVCLSNCRQFGNMLTAYCADYRDALPAYHSDAPDQLRTPAQQNRYCGQHAFMFGSNLWNEYCEVRRTNTVAFCPRVQRAFLATYGPGSRFRSDYEIVACAYIDPSVLDPSGDYSLPHPAAGARLQRLGSVLFPSQKVGILEQRVWHAWSGSWHPRVDMTYLEAANSPGLGSVWFFDGHGTMARSKDYPGVARRWLGQAPFHMTPFGLHGRDVPRQ